MRRRVLTTLLAAAALVLGAVTVASAAQAATLGQVVQDFRADGSISACTYSVDDLRRIRHEAKGQPKLAPRAFRKALRAAITQLKTGGCPKQGTTPPPPTTTTTTPGAATPAPSAGPAAAKPASSGGTDAGTIALVAVGAVVVLALLAALALAIARWRAWDPEWALGARHAVGEAGYRVTSTWEDFRDWLRLGR